ncbi:hypothetical protein [Nocardiopsis sp. NPDC057823]|uniref:hypothetical protein n=1 Tax=Nocardiopsis sp. NPDC057823 TaxID=3346256 RepID=UPI00366B4119
MTSPLAGLVGEQRPRLWTAPPRISSAGQEAVELAATAGLILDPWEAWVLDESLGERADGTWAASSVAVVVPRQNGKGSILEARELAGLFLFGEKTIIHSAHEFKTSKEAFLRIRGLIERTPDLAKRVARFALSHGEEGVHLKDGRRLLFATRSSGGGRGFSGDVVILDEAYNLTDAGMAALIPTLGTAENPQTWYTTSSPDKNLAPCEVISRVRERALGDNPGRLAYFEWSIDPHTDFCPADCDEHDDVDDPESVRRANPGLGIRLNPESVENEQAMLSPTDFARERLGVGNWHSTGRSWLVISQEHWEAIADLDSDPLDPVCFALACTPDLSYGCIAVAGAREDGLLHTEITSADEEQLDHRPGIGWMVERAKHLQDTWGPCAFVVDRGGPAGALIPRLEEAGVETLSPSTREYAGACMTYYSGAVPREGNPPILRHRDQAPLNAAVAGVTWRDLADLKAWNRRGAVTDISPLEASTLAVWGYSKKGHIVPQETSAPWVMYR